MSVSAESLRGCFDLHIHTSPDIVPRKCDDLELAQRLLACGMRGCAIKSHHTDTAARALLLQKAFPELEVFGGVTLNHAVGGVNPAAVLTSAQTGGRFVWFPTLDALNYQRYHHRSATGVDVSDGISLFDEAGDLLPPVLEILDIAARYRLVVGTGHISPAEGMALVREGGRRGCRIVLTHADNPADPYTLCQQMQAVEQGAFIEHCYFTTYFGRTPIETVAEQIRSVGCEHVILSTDFGQPTAPFCDEGMAQYISLLLEQGFTRGELALMTRRHPDTLFA